MRHRACVRRIQVEVAGENRQALGIRCLDGQHAAALQARAASRIISGRRSGGRCSTTCAQKMPSSELSGSSARYTKRSAASACRPFRAAHSTRLRAQIDATRGDAGVAHQLQKLAAPAADIQHLAPPGEIGQIELLALLTYSSVPRKRSAKRA